ncbi:hypothetical protein FVE85_2198 [Porphyridium purpureum]|uniref:J domain-containing protein n=1 Tax=Porphyridium purpureum TaxID=35688 RepID=A0A5J4YZK9_PORPP|nr:hypothetical protein FVE85_2198 [Porphyridium purpureum]|eukprot:POR2535..scf209_3
MGGKGDDDQDQQMVQRALKDLDLVSSTLEELQLANVVTRSKQVVQFSSAYGSDQEDSDSDEEDGRVFTQREYHDSGQLRMYRTYQVKPNPNGSGVYQRLIEEKHFNPDGVCMVDIHFSVGQPYLSRKHYHPSQSLKSEKLFYVEDEVKMICRKAHYWREYYDGGGTKSEVQYDGHGVRIGFCKRYGRDGSILWIKDYTREYQDNLHEFKSRIGELDFSYADAAKHLGFDAIPATMKEVERQYRLMSLPLHPDKQGVVSEEMTEKFIELSRARDSLREYFDMIAENGTGGDRAEKHDGQLDGKKLAPMTESCAIRGQRLIGAVRITKTPIEEREGGARDIESRSQMMHQQYPTSDLILQRR